MKKILMIIGGIVLGVLVLGIIIFMVVFGTSKRMVCKSSEGNITIMYDDKTLKGYTAKGIIYDFDTQKEYASIIGVDAYLTEFSTWFSSNTSGSCSR